MTKKIKKKYKKWSSDYNTLSAEYIQALKTIHSGDFLHFINFVIAVDKEKGNAFEAGYISALEHAGGKKK